MRKSKIIGIAKRDLKAGEIFEVPIDLTTLEIKINDSINFIEGTTINDLMGENEKDNCGS